MDMDFKKRFLSLWEKFFNLSQLPLIFFYSADNTEPAPVKPGSVDRCLIGALNEVRNGRSLRFNSNSIGCPGGMKYLGFSEKLMPNFEYFLSCGLPGRMEGERYKKSPAIVKEIIRNWPGFTAPAPSIVFKRWDNLEARDEPQVVIFFATPDVLSGLFTLANYDESRPEGVIAPMSSGCSAIVNYPYQEMISPHPRAVIGMFDPSARSSVDQDRLTFAVPFSRFITMVDNMEESFLTTKTWQELQKRI